jgi:glyoxylase-like metal-dependent hydrolase (beta-lactamase superfamily II)
MVSRAVILTHFHHDHTGGLAFRLRDRVNNVEKYDSCPVRIFSASPVLTDQLS